MSPKLAINGGKKVREKPFPRHPIIGENEKKAVMGVLDGGNLSTFIASHGKNFLGGEKIRKFESDFAEIFDSKYAVAMNSATACLHAAVVACGVKPGEEVIVPPYTFTSTATCALMNNSIPVFVDIDEENFCINPKKIEESISPLTKAIIPVHLFGNAAEMDEIMEIAKKHKLKVIEDCAQAPGGEYKGKFVGTIGDCGIFSFTESKTITTGEGGMLITDNNEIAEIAQLIRNHGEAVVAGMQRSYKSTILGFCYRMTEFNAALGIEQLKRLNEFNDIRIKLANYLKKGLSAIDGIIPCSVKDYVKHVYYLVPFKYDESKIGIPRNLFVEAMNAEGIPTGAGYVNPLYRTSIYHENKPFIYKHYKGKARYDNGLCPVAERMYEKELITFQVVRPPATRKDMDDIIKAAKKIINNKDELKNAT